MTPEAIIAHLGMQPHPEGGHDVETWRDEPQRGGRSDRVLAISAGMAQEGAARVDHAAHRPEHDRTEGSSS